MKLDATIFLLLPEHRYALLKYNPQLFVRLCRQVAERGFSRAVITWICFYYIEVARNALFPQAIKIQASVNTQPATLLHAAQLRNLRQRA